MDPRELFQTFLAAGWPCWIALSDPRLSQVLGTTPGALRKASWRGAMPVAITPGPGRRQGVLLTDLAAWLAGVRDPAPIAPPTGLQPPTDRERRRPGRPRKATTVGLGGFL
jgi:hypothetical protein